MNITIIENKEDWDKLLSEVINYDFYHTYDYHQIAKKNSEKAVIIKYEREEFLIGLPLLIRKIDNSQYFDATSVYGYSGPLINELPSSNEIEQYQKELTQFFLKKNIISVFTRLHPFIPYQNTILKDFGKTISLGKVVNIDLSIDPGLQRQKYHRRLKNHVNKANRNLTLKIAKSKEDYATYISLYRENMERVSAKSFYYFEDDYFEKLINAGDFNTRVLLAVDNESEKVIAGGMFIETNNIIQYHLSGAANDFLHLNGIKFLIDHMRLIANKEGNSKMFNLGGGLGANESDSLFRFKSSFSDDFHQFYVWKLIVNNEAYLSICEKNNIVEKDSTFFPLYRLHEHN